MQNRIRTFILTISDKGSRGERVDETGPLIASLLPEDVYSISRTDLVPDDLETIRNTLREACDSRAFDLILTNGGTGFSPRDVTPEATMAIVERPVPGIPEAMRLASLAITPKAILSRAAAGIRGLTLIVNLPGSPKAAKENLEAVLGALPHGIQMLTGGPTDCAEPLAPEASTKQAVADLIAADAHVISVNISQRKGTVKKEVPSIELRPDWGIEGDAHAGKWHRQVSLLAEESIATMRPKVSFDLKNGIFAENINTIGVQLKLLPVGTLLKVGEAILRVTQIGKQCHNDGCAIQRATGNCVMPTEGIFAEVVTGGVVKAGDSIQLA